jgi:predicted transport protein
MKAEDRPYTKLHNGTYQFVIPVFQRDYSWTESQCEQLWNDVVRTGKAPSNATHFLGSVVYIGTGDSSAAFNRYLLIDGQQRVTTLSLLVAALRDHIRETGWNGGPDAPTVDRLDRQFLINRDEDGERRYKLVLRRTDDTALRAIVDGESRSATGPSRILGNYEWFREQLRSADPSVVFTGISRLIVVDVTLHRGTDDPQLVFESLNSTGMDLSQADLIRNYILMRLPEREQTRIYDNFWQKIEALFRGAEQMFDVAVRDFLALKTTASKQERADQIYFAFRRHFADLIGTPDRLAPLLEQMLRHARYHAAFSLGVDAPLPLSEPLSRVRNQADVPAILVVRLFDCYEVHKTLSIEDFERALTLIESYLVRRAVCGAQTRGYWQVFAGLAYRLNTEDPLQSLAVGLAREKESYAFPSDESFTTELRECDLYHKRVCRSVLERLENLGTREPTNTSSMTIEHVLPQNDRLSAEWQAMLGPGWQEAHRATRHRLGNLTLTAYNSEYSDRSFAEKKTIAGGFNDSAVRLNKFIREQPRWSTQEIRTRGEALIERALKAWPPLQVARGAIEATERRDLETRAAKRNVRDVEMTERARELFVALHSRLIEIVPGQVEIAETHSVCYFAPELFLEVIPRSNRITLLLQLEFATLKDPPFIASDAREWKFITHSKYAAGVLVAITSLEQIEVAVPLIQQSRALSDR